MISEEFDRIVGMLKFNDLGTIYSVLGMFDGRIVHQLVVNESNLKAGIQQINNIDASRIRKVKNVKYKKDPPLVQRS